MPLCLALRARIGLLAQEGLSKGQIAQALKTSSPTVLLWRSRFATGGPWALEQDAPRGQSPRRTDLKLVSAIGNATLQTSPLDATHEGSHGGVMQGLKLGARPASQRRLVQPGSGRGNQHCAGVTGRVRVLVPDLERVQNASRSRSSLGIKLSWFFQVGAATGLDDDGFALVRVTDQHGADTGFAPRPGWPRWFPGRVCP